MKQVVVLSAALAAALVGAYVTWTREEVEVDDDAVPLYAASPADLEKVAWKSEDLTVTIERRKDARGEYLWVDSTEVKRKKKPKKDDPHPGEVEEEGEEAEGDESPAEEPSDEEPPEVKQQAFMSNSTGEDTWKALAPLHALRELEATSADPATFGLTEPTATIEVHRRSGPITLTVGGETYGNKDKYVGIGGKVYLVDDATLKPIQFAAGRLIERNLFPLSEKEAEQVAVQVPGGATITYVQQNKDDAAKAFWARSDATDKEDEAGATWLGKAFRLKLRDYVAEAKTDLVPVVTYTVSGKGESWKVEILKSSAEPVEWYARTDYNRSLVSLTESLVRNVVDDLDSLAGP